MKNLFVALNLLTIILIFTHCATDDSFNPDNDTGINTPTNNDNNGSNTNTLDNRGLPLTTTDPIANPTSDAKVELGRLLFWDPVLSGEKDVACATCHHPQFGYSDGRELPIGVGGIGIGPNRFDGANDDIGLVQRNSPTIINTAFNGIRIGQNYVPEAAPMFWDNRVESLEAQTILPTMSFEEMRGHTYEENETLPTIIARLNAIPEYQTQFQTAFGGNNPINSDNIGRAIATFERSIVANNSPFDRYARGDENALTDQQIDGMQRFDAVGCDNCHAGQMFSDYELHILAVPDNQVLGFSDDGANSTYAFRTPTLRNLNVTQPYFHNGVAGNLQTVLNFYNQIQNGNNGGGGNDGLNANPNVNDNQIDPLIGDLNLRGNDIQPIIAFIQALNDDSFDKTIPASVPSGLQVGGRIN
ncbi:MAG: cytochrome c peroxidase [Paraglaciecola sp.]|jgi:cytochrome c peroxidase